MWSAVSDLPVVWVGTEAHSEEAARALAEWARARGVVLQEPTPARAVVAVDASLPDAIEKELARAYEALGADDADAAGRAIGRVDAMSREHPEIPAAPFLRAEMLRAWSRLRLRLGDEAGAAAAWQDAEALDGGRVAGIGEKHVPPPAKVPLTIHANADVTVDGRAPAPEVLPGEHVIVAKRDGAIVHVSWLAVRGPLEVTLPLDGDACRLPAFAHVTRASAAGVTCGAWLMAEPSEHGVMLARC